MPREITLSSGRTVTVPDDPDTVTLSSGRVVRVPSRAPSAPESVGAAPMDEEGPGLGAGLLGAGALLGTAALARKPGLVMKGLGKLNAVRQQLMLSGYATPKSVLGNIGATAIESAERGTTAPLRQLFSRQTARDFVENYKNPVLEPGSTIIAGPTPGRVMGAMDTATRNALRRGGLSATEAERAVLQSPLTGDLGEALDSPFMRHLIPFRRTPFNQFLEGGKTYTRAFKGENQIPLAISHIAGAAHGAATADERYPASLGFGTAAAAKYGLPYAVGAVAGRYLGGGADAGGIATSALPVSEYGIESGITNPLGAFSRPAALRVLRDLGIIEE